jgi:hypothetical protein
MPSTERRSAAIHPYTECNPFKRGMSLIPKRPQTQEARKAKRETIRKTQSKKKKKERSLHKGNFLAFRHCQLH